MDEKSRRGRAFRQELKNGLWFIFPIFIVFAFWEFISRLEVVNPILLPPPTMVFEHLWGLLSPKGVGGISFFLERHTLVSFYRIMIGYSIAAVSCTFLGFLMGVSKRAYGFFNPIITLILPIPGLAWVPIVILWLGLNDLTIIFIVLLVSIFPIIYNTAAGVRAIAKKQIWAAEMMGATRGQIMWKVLFPGAMPYIIAGQKLALGSAWRALVGTEMVVATGWGLGYLIFEARTFMDTATVYGGIAMIALLGLIIEKIIFGRIEKMTIERWGLSRTL
jgi:ABC-type nitrate/sulfonate/bicarbonate transport system permease component